MNSEIGFLDLKIRSLKCRNGMGYENIEHLNRIRLTIIRLSELFPDKTLDAHFLKTAENYACMAMKILKNGFFDAGQLITDDLIEVCEAGIDYLRNLEEEKDEK